MSEREREWRIVDAAGAPHDDGSECWPIFWDEQQALEALDLAVDDCSELHLEVRRVDPWTPYSTPENGSGEPR